MKFFNIDCHASVIADIKYIFEKLGHKVDHKSLSGHVSLPIGTVLLRQHAPSNLP